MGTPVTSKKTPSPCRSSCRLDPARILCTTCGRTLDEIAAWSDAPEWERAVIIKRAAARLTARTKPSPIGSVTGGTT
jgi:predicted Fe-S protein YdhL (DUF1289 family)